MRYTTQEGADTQRQHRPYHQKQWPKALRERVSNNKLKRVKLKKLNQELYALNYFSPNMQLMDQKIP